MTSIEQKRAAIYADIIAKQTARSTVVAQSDEIQPENKKNEGQAREVYKDLKIKKQNNVSRNGCEETDKTCLRPGVEEEQSQKQTVEASVSVLEGSCSAPARTTTRAISGISAQQSITKQGIKVNLTIQTIDDAETGDVIKLTAEMKRATRIRELPAYAGDSEEFAMIYHNAKQEIKSIETKAKKDLVCIGRIHESGKRAAWFADMCLVGTLNENGVLINVMLMNCEEGYPITMDHELSPKQKTYYLSAGFYGKLVTTKEAPSLKTAKRIPYGK